MSAACRACGAPVLWAETMEGKRMPIDPWDDPNGNLAVRSALGVLYARLCKPDHPLLAGERRKVSHFATCPQGDSMRRRRPVRRPSTLL